MSRVSVEIENHVARVTMTRGDKMNALDVEMVESLIAAGEALIGNDDIRAVVLSGEGPAFCAGLDVANFGRFAAEDPEALIMPRTHGQSNAFQRVSLVWRDVPVPVIAALHGVTFGGGLQIALGADIRIAHPETRLSIMEMKWGLVPDMGGMVVLPKLLRSDVLRKLTYTADQVAAEEAQAIGLVTELSDDPKVAALALAEKIAGKSPSATLAAKRLIAVAESGASEADVLLEESREQAALIGKPHQMEVIAANMQKRAAVFD
ncbi:crotonase/enoyl-CoA hydratase family protein [Thalassovita aquimarina]|uniref:Crotonase/enoyl-CoA hydratase family protein n=1 Tax=Thalassovita aquimarina TaxID=2785917 RepID=A0ABS5HTC8_9RHOB|nr:crotonase/enoyl-CoA hydratase family protein [Thalassovita aquimarina]MBR9652234.1 crotonase/enoyl-CoA hydratase family protein [Thalassovita aquimarina]